MYSAAQNDLHHPFIQWNFLRNNLIKLSKYWHKYAGDKEINKTIKLVKAKINKNDR